MYGPPGKHEFPSWFHAAGTHSCRFCGNLTLAGLHAMLSVFMKRKRSLYSPYSFLSLLSLPIMVIAIKFVLCQNCLGECCSISVLPHVSESHFFQLGKEASDFLAATLVCYTQSSCAVDPCYGPVSTRLNQQADHV